MSFLLSEFLLSLVSHLFCLFTILKGFTKMPLFWKNSFFKHYIYSVHQLMSNRNNLFLKQTYHFSIPSRHSSYIFSLKNVNLTIPKTSNTISPVQYRFYTNRNILSLHQRGLWKDRFPESWLVFILVCNSSI